MIYLSWILFCISDGIADGFFYHLRDHNKFSEINEHHFFFMRRLTVAVVFFTHSDFSYILLFSMATAQPFLHNNSYYNTRHILNKKVYDYGLFNQSSTSSAWSTKLFTPNVRIVLLTLSTLLICLQKLGYISF